MEMEKIIKECSLMFSNDVRVVNTTPHTITFLDGEEVKEVPSNRLLLVNATASEVTVAPHLVRTVFSPNEEGQQLIESIKEIYPDALIVGSLIAANAYNDVVSMVAAPGYERVAPAEKRMSTEKFNVGECF